MYTKVHCEKDKWLKYLEQDKQQGTLSKCAIQKMSY